MFLFLAVLGPAFGHAQIGRAPDPGPQNVDSGGIFNTSVCDGPNCDFPSLLKLAKNVMNFLILLSIPVFGIIAAYAGWTMLTSGGSEGARDKAKQMFTKGIVGFLWVLGAWLIVWTITTALLDPHNFTNLLN